jgi:hypothetical protein
MNKQELEARIAVLEAEDNRSHLSEIVFAMKAELACLNGECECCEFEDETK